MSGKCFHCRIMYFFLCHIVFLSVRVFGFSGKILLYTVMTAECQNLKKKKYNIKSFNWERWGKCRHRVDWPTNKLDTERHSIRNVLDSQIFQEVLLLVPQGCTIFVYFSFVCCCLCMCVWGGGLGQTRPSLNIISTAFNCSHDTESEYIWLWFMGSFLYSSIWYFQKMTPFWFLIAWKIKTTDTKVRAIFIQNLMK